MSAFLILEQIEDRIDKLGRTSANIERYRGRYSTKVWAAIRKRRVSVVQGERVYGHYWPKTSKLYGACDYIINNYEKLAVNLRDTRLPENNNLAECVMRRDKIMQDASKFRKTDERLLRIDILRTIVHTCSAANVDLKDYLIFIFKNRNKIEVDPASHTPYAFALLQNKVSKSRPKVIH